MKITPSLEEVNQYRKTGLYKVVPVCCELLSDTCTPIQAVRKLKNVSSHCFLLESAEAQENWGRYSFLGFDPKTEHYLFRRRNARWRCNADHGKTRPPCCARSWRNTKASDSGNASVYRRSDRLLLLRLPGLR